MPNTKSASKRMRQEQKRRVFNRRTKSIVKTANTKARQAIATPVIDQPTTADAVRIAVSELDRAAKKV